MIAQPTNTNIQYEGHRKVTVPRSKVVTRRCWVETTILAGRGCFRITNLKILSPSKGSFVLPLLSENIQYFQQRILCSSLIIWKYSVFPAKDPFSFPPLLSENIQSFQRMLCPSPISGDNQYVSFYDTSYPLQHNLVDPNVFLTQLFHIIQLTIQGCWDIMRQYFIDTGHYFICMEQYLINIGHYGTLLTFATWLICQPDYFSWRGIYR